MNIKHTSKVKHYNGTNSELAEAISDLFYDTLSELLHELAVKTNLDAEKDYARGRTKLASELTEAAKHIEDASKHIANAWEICAPYVDQWLAENKLKREDCD